MGTWFADMGKEWCSSRRDDGGRKLYFGWYEDGGYSKAGHWGRYRWA